VLARFAGVGVANTLIDVVLFMLLHDRLGIVAANFVSTVAGMTFSFVVNGLFTFRAQRLTLRHAVLFLATNGVTLWVLQPLVIHALLALAPGGEDPGDLLVLGVKVAAIGVSFVLNFVAYRWVVWPAVGQPETATDAGTVSSDPRP
jgi:putative flippase GtrA